MSFKLVSFFHIYFGYMGAKSPGRIEPKVFLEEDIPDVFTCFKFGDDRFRGLAPAEGQILPFPIDFDGRPYNTLTLLCERVINNIQSGPKKLSHILLSISSPNNVRFSKVFQRHILWKICNKLVTTYTTTPYLCRYTTL